LKAIAKHYQPLTRREAKSLYRRPGSFTDLLPWVEYNPGTRAFLLDDGFSVGALFELRPVSCEARPEGFLVTLREQLQGVITEAIPEEDDSPWILQLYVQDEPALTGLDRPLRGYAGQRAGDQPFTRHYLDLLHAHLQQITRPGGLFIDEAVTGASWRGKTRRVRAVLYRRLPRGSGYRALDGLYPTEALDEVCYKLTTALDEVGVLAQRGGGRELYEWLVPWFNPAPALAEGDPLRLLTLAPYPGDEDLPFGRDLAESFTFSMPRTDLKTHTWWFDGLPHGIVSIQALRLAPRIGHFTAEQRAGEHLFALFDRFPEHSIVAMTLTITPQDRISHHIHQIRQAAGGGGAEARLTREDAQAADLAMAQGNKIYPLSLAVYLRGSDWGDLRRKTNQAHALLIHNGLQPIYQNADLVGLDSYIRHLPMAYEAALDKTRRRSRLVFAHHLASLLPLYGRSRGTGHPGLLFYNRGAEPLTFDPLNPADRKKSAHTVILGPTGAGKSALLVYLLMQLMAVYRPRLVIIESGNSFGLLGQYFAECGLAVNPVTLNPSADVSLPPFADALKLLSEAGRRPSEIQAEDILRAEFEEEVSPEEDEEDLHRDLLGEMEIAARIMITGGDEREDARLTRPDRLVIRKAILLAAETVQTAGRGQVITADVVAAFNTLAQDPALPDSRRLRAQEMGDGMELFCSGLAGRFFNRPGESWPEADVTLLDMGVLAREGYQDQLTVAFLGMLNRINDRVERGQYDGRQTLVVADEGHLITTNPLLAPYVVKITKMWRKLGAWFWIATQNLEDFPDASKRMLNMMEWWLCLVMPKEEVDQIARFRQLTDEHRALLLSARKEPGKYVEGVVLSDTLQALFRSVVPPLCLALAMTEPEEKAERARLMREHHCSELEAARLIARRIEKARAA
jgi:conjugative transfer ATPase